MLTIVTMKETGDARLDFKQTCTDILKPHLRQSL